MAIVARRRDNGDGVGLPTRRDRPGTFRASVHLPTKDQSMTRSLRLLPVAAIIALVAACTDHHMENMHGKAVHMDDMHGEPVPEVIEVEPSEAPFESPELHELDPAPRRGRSTQ